MNMLLYHKYTAEFGIKRMFILSTTHKQFLNVYIFLWNNNLFLCRVNEKTVTDIAKNNSLRSDCQSVKF